MRVIAVWNKKGGVGKTTVTLNLAYALRTRGNLVLAVDMDPQGNLGQGLGVEPNAGHPLTDALLYDGPFAAAIVPTQWENLSLAPSDGPMLETAEARLGERLTGSEALSAALGTVAENYDFALIDCRPSLGALVNAALMAADIIIAPVEAGRYALEGLAALFEAKASLEAQEVREPRPLWLLVNRWNKSDPLADWTNEQLKTHRKITLKTRIRPSPPINAAAAVQEPVMVYSPRSNGAQDFPRLAAEVERLWRK